MLPSFDLPPDRLPAPAPPAAAAAAWRGGTLSDRRGAARSPGPLGCCSCSFCASSSSSSSYIDVYGAATTSTAAAYAAATPPAEERHVRASQFTPPVPVQPPVPVHACPEGHDGPTQTWSSHGHAVLICPTAPTHPSEPACTAVTLVLLDLVLRYRQYRQYRQQHTCGTSISMRSKHQTIMGCCKGAQGGQPSLCSLGNCA